MNRCIFLFLALFLFSGSLFSQVDTVPPVLVCKSLVTIMIPPPCCVSVKVNEFIDSVFDNSGTIVDLGVRKTCTGAGFPENKTSVKYYESEWGTQYVDVWARDKTGNTSSCMVKAFVEDASGSVDPFFSVRTRTPDAMGICNTKIVASGVNCFSDSFSLTQFTSCPLGEWGQFGALLNASGYESTVTPSKNINPQNGVTSYDLVQIQKHILGQQLLDSPYRIIAADASQDGKVTAYDIVLLRKLILGYINELPNGRSWRFIPEDYTFPNSANPFLPSFPERIEISNTTDPPPNIFHFIGLKIGDVDYSADPNQ